MIIRITEQTYQTVYTVASSPGLPHMHKKANVVKFTFSHVCGRPGDEAILWCVYKLTPYGKKLINSRYN